MWLRYRKTATHPGGALSARCRLVAWMASLALGFAALPVAGAQPPVAEGRAPLLDLAARAEVDGYARLDEMTRRSAAIPNVFDPGQFASRGAETIRRALREHLAWLESTKAGHLNQIEALPVDMGAIETPEPYRSELIADIEAITPERATRVADCYDGERAAAEAQLAFLEFLENSEVSVSSDGFTFVSSADVVTYTGHVAEVNRAFEAQDNRLGRYYAWELRQKARLRQYRDRL